MRREEGKFRVGAPAKAASPKVESWRITRYYTPLPNQRDYFYDRYETDFFVNCSGDCLNTADGTNLRNKAPLTVLACPRSFKFGQKIYIRGIGVATCHDRGGAIRGKRLDLWAGASDVGLWMLKHGPQGGWYDIQVL